MWRAVGRWGLKARRIVGAASLEFILQPSRPPTPTLPVHIWAVSSASLPSTPQPPLRAQPHPACDCPAPHLPYAQLGSEQCCPLPDALTQPLKPPTSLVHLAPPCL